MTTLPDKPAATRWTNVLLVAVFVALLWLPTFDGWLHFDQSPAFNEKRPAAAWPQSKPGLDGLQQYVRGLEAYFNDHFGFRKQLIHWHIQWQQALFNGGRSDVMMGENGHLFFDEHGMHMAENFQGILQFSPTELASLKQLHQDRRDWLAQRGIQYLFVVAPDKQSVYPEYLPAWLKAKGRATKLDQFLAYMREHSTIAVPDLRPALREAKRIAPTYYKTDSHWNSFGGFVASEEIAKTLSGKMAFEPLSLDSFEIKTTPLERGDLALLLGVYTHEDDRVLAPKSNLPLLAETVENSQYAVPARFTTNASAQGGCVVFRDSFGPALIPFLGHHFKTVGYFWSPGGFDTNIIASMKPDVVISEIVERHFNNSSN